MVSCKVSERALSRVYKAGCPSGLYKVVTVEVILFPFLPRGERVELCSMLAVIGEGPSNAQVQLKLAYVIVCLLADSTESWTTCVVCDCGLSFLLEMAQPTYKDLLDLLEQAESQTGSHLSTAELLTIKFSESYPHITISRPSRFLETVRRITTPIVNGRLQGDEKEEYLESGLQEFATQAKVCDN